MDEIWRFFRFKTVNRYFWNELIKCELFHSAPEDFNDPFDCRVDTNAALPRALASELTAERRATLHTIKQAFEVKKPQLDVGVCCFSVNAENPLMWAHYADSHHGVCLVYEFPRYYFNERYPLSDSAPYFIGCEGVHYGDDVFSDWLISGDFDFPLHGLPIENAVSRLHVSKADCWKHEEEVRMVVSEVGCKLAFEPTFLKQVIFGLNTPDNEKLLIAAIARRHNSDVALRQATKSVARDFALEFPFVQLKLGDEMKAYLNEKHPELVALLEGTR